MRVAVFLEGVIESGGGYQYQLTVAQILKKYGGNEHEFIFFVSNQAGRETLEELGLNVHVYNTSFLTLLKRLLSKNFLVYSLLRKLRLHLTKLDKVLLDRHIDLVYFTSPNFSCADLTVHNYIYTVWDLCHRDYMEFPEVYKFKEFEKREELYTNYLKKAVAVIAESEYGKQNIIRRYGVDSSRISVQPFLDSKSFKNKHQIEYIDISEKYNLNNDFIFYPAQFWPHKNHIYILKALRILKKEHNRKIPVVFSGSDKGNLSYIMKKAKDFEVDALVNYIGFVSQDELKNLYEQALAMVMPTYFGPTNIPPIEAFSFQCPVCYPNLDGLKEQVGEAGWLIDLKEPSSLAEALIEIKSDISLVRNKIQLGKQKLSENTEAHFWKNLKNIFDDYSYKKECWGNFSLE